MWDLRVGQHGHFHFENCGKKHSGIWDFSGTITDMHEYKFQGDGFRMISFRLDHDIEIVSGRSGELITVKADEPIRLSEKNLRSIDGKEAGRVYLSDYLVG